MSKVVGIAREALVADAVLVVVVRDAERVGPADGVGAGIHAELGSRRGAVGDGGADLVVAAVGVVVAGGGGGAALDQVVGIVSLESLGAEALADAADGVGAAVDVRAEILHLRARHQALLEGVPDEAQATAAVVPAGGVDADGVLPADVAKALVDVGTTGIGDPVETALADALRAAAGHGADRVGAATHVGASCLSLRRFRGASGVGVPDVASVADALEGSAVLTVSVSTARRGADGRVRRRHADEERVAEEAVGADADTAGGVAEGVEAAADGSAALHALAVGAAHLSGLPARLGGGAAQLRGAPPSRVGVAEHPLQADARGPGGGDDAAGVESALDAVALRDARTGRVLLEPGLAAAPGGVVLRDAVGVLPAGHRRARVDAFVADAGELAGAVVVLLALLVPPAAGAAGDVRVALAAARALADEPSGPVDADGALAAGVVQALVDVVASRERVPRESLLTEALRRARGSALGIQAAAEPVAGTLAPIPVEVVDEEGGRAYAGTAHAALVLPAAPAGIAGRPGGRADAGEGVAGGALGTEAGE